MNKHKMMSWSNASQRDLDVISSEVKDLIGPLSLLLLSGELGAGKTTFSKAFINSSEETMSPTYSLISETQTTLHADFYRLKDISEIMHLELELYLEDKEYFLLEWGEKYFCEVQRYLPDEYFSFILEIDFSSKADHRNFTLFKINSL